MHDILRFQSLASGSSGNCYFLGNEKYGILIDAGIGVRTIRKQLRLLGLDYHAIWAVFVTHDHADHIRAVGAIGEKHFVPIYSTNEVHKGIDSSYCVTEKLTMSRKFIEKGETVQIGDFRITSFPVSHDAHDNVGYFVEYNGRTFTFATDLGYVGQEAREYLRKAENLIFEANYDEYMLLNGKYPKHLQERIMRDTGHLSNDQAATFLAENYCPTMKNVFLCHLSRENNTPEIAYDTVAKRLINKGVDVENDLKIVPLERYKPSRVYAF
jgi:phosphoribosyl 1,2-cyclic phosphodiesterase